MTFLVLICRVYSQLLPSFPRPCKFPPFTVLTMLPKGQRLQLPTDSRPISILTADSKYMNGIIFLNSQSLKQHEDQIQKTTISLI